MNAQTQSPSLEQTTTTQLGPFQRLWRGFLTGRLMLVVAVSAMLASDYAVSGSIPDRVLWLAAIFLLQALAVRVVLRDYHPSKGLAWHWLLTIGFDIIACTLLQIWLIDGSINLVALFGVPILMAAALGSNLVMGLTVVAVLIALNTILCWTYGIAHIPAHLLYQAFLAWLGFLLLALLVHHLATRLLREEEQTKKSQRDAFLLSKVNALIIQNLSDGVLVLDKRLNIHAINPAAIEMLNAQNWVSPPSSLLQNSSWQPLVVLARTTFSSQKPQSEEFSLQQELKIPIGIQARTWLTEDLSDDGEGAVMHPHCVIFMHDLREIQAQLRTEKLASMGRMSAAVAHEIRNPLSAIVQANSLLAEDLTDTGAQRLTSIIRKNAERLTRTAEDILEIARIPTQIQDNVTDALLLDDFVAQTWHEWISHAPRQRFGLLALSAPDIAIVFAPDHLRRILINLLDNALRYMGPHADSLQVRSWRLTNGKAAVQVWSDGKPLEKSVERHLFEPFFSSESRSSGLGLYLCRELCERNHASISYERAPQLTQRGTVEGNAFTVHFHEQPANVASIVRATSQFAGLPH